ncbi:MAG: HlyD family efflux transporter periplasmic adaptor subunit [Alkalibacterium sp.]|nr:HlyD family efflux transporter periplasmic adaptor subunit [Alkalibacterium sp.]TVP90690.1 MAG: HlyD family efflux transporter periplasmic adaptor subunit [Alkalibacterium sp.]
MKGKKWIGIILFILFAAFVGYSVYQSSQEDETVTVRTTEVSSDSLTEVVMTTGMIDPSETQEIVGQGVVSELNVSKGDTVEEGDTLVTYIDGTSFTAQFDGTVTEVNVTEEEADTNAQQGQPSIVIANLDELEVSLQLSRSDASLIEVDQQVEMNYADELYEGVISSIDPVATQQQTQMGSSALLGAIVSFDSDTDGLIAGFEIDVDIIVDSVEDALVIPIEALNHDEDNNPYVYTVGADNELIQVMIETGIQSDARIEVAEGLNEGDEIVLSPGDNFEEGQQVEVED